MPKISISKNISTLKKYNIDILAFWYFWSPVIAKERAHRAMNQSAKDHIHSEKVNKGSSDEPFIRVKTVSGQSLCKPFLVKTKVHTITLIEEPSAVRICD